MGQKAKKLSSKLNQQIKCLSRCIMTQHTKFVYFHSTDKSNESISRFRKQWHDVVLLFLMKQVDSKCNSLNGTINPHKINDFEKWK